MRMMACADFSGNNDKGRKDKASEMRRLKTIYKKEHVARQA